jgi:hypothetical protein
MRRRMPQTARPAGHRVLTIPDDRGTCVGTVEPMSKVLVTGMSGTGKSSALAMLARRGYRTVETDDPDWREYRAYASPPDEMHQGEWLWIEDKISDLLGSESARSLFVAGCVPNQGRFYDRFDAVVLMSAPAEVILRRVEQRTTNPYGKIAVERAMILTDLEEVEPLLRAGCTHELDASRPLVDVVNDLIAIASNSTTR